MDRKVRQECRPLRKKNKNTRLVLSSCHEICPFFPVCWPQSDVLEWIKNVNKIPPAVSLSQSFFLITFLPSTIFTKRISVCSEGSNVYKETLRCLLFSLPPIPPKHHKRGNVSQKVCIWQSWLAGYIWAGPGEQKGRGSLSPATWIQKSMCSPV